jgi:hypothetical protein
MWELWVIYKNLLYNDEFWFIFHLKKREKHHFHDTILTMDWTPEMQNLVYVQNVLGPVQFE